MPKPWTSLSLRKNNVGQALTTRQVTKLRKEGDITSLGQLVSDRGKAAMRDILQLSDKAIETIVQSVTPASSRPAEKGGDMDGEAKQEPPAKPDTPTKPDTPAKPDAPANSMPPPESKQPATQVDMEVTRDEGPSMLGVAETQNLSAVPEAEPITNALTDKESANGVGLFADGADRILPAVAVGPVTEQAALATTEDGTSSAQVASQFEPTTGSDNTLPQNRDGDEGRLAPTRPSSADTNNVFGRGATPAGVGKGSGSGGLPSKVSTSSVSQASGGGGGGMSTATIADAVKDAIRDISSTAPTPGQKETPLTNELRPFLPIAGSNDVAPIAGSDELKKENLSIAFEYKPHGWPLDTVNNPLALNNRIEQGIRWSGKLDDLPSIHPGGSLTQGARVYESYPQLSSADVRLATSKRKLGSVASMESAAGSAKRVRTDGSYSVWNAATQSVTDGVYESVADSNPLMSVLIPEVNEGMDLRMEVYPSAAESVQGQPGAFSVESGGVPVDLMRSADYNPTASRPGVTQHILV